MNKQSSSTLDSIISTMNPFGYWRGTVDTKGLPRLFKDNQNNTLAWNTIGATATGGTIAALATIAANKYYQKKWGQSSDKIVKSKVNAYKPHVGTTAQRDVTTEEEKQPWSQTLLALTKHANGGVKNVIINSIYGATPVVATLGSMWMANKIVGDNSADDYERELDTKIEEETRKLQELQEEVLAIQQTGLSLNKRACEELDYEAVESAAKKRAKEDKMNDPNYTGVNWLSMLATVVPLASLGLASIAGVGGYQYYAKNDKNRKKMSVLKEMANANLTNIPQEITFTTADITPKESISILDKLENKEDAIIDAELVNEEETPRIEETLPIEEESSKDLLFI